MKEREEDKKRMEMLNGEFQAQYELHDEQVKKDAEEEANEKGAAVKA